FFFFFSSRRRHTRFSRDWSSDVCSSDLGATLDAVVFGEGYIEVGTLLARNLTTGKFEPFTTTEGYDNFSILNIDVNCNGEDDIIVGEVIVRGSVYEDKLPVKPSAEFKAATPMIRY